MIVAWFAEAANDDFFQPQGASGVKGCAVAVIDKQAGYARPDGSHSYNCDFCFLHYVCHDLRESVGLR
jgi:hypothetical protein